MSLVARILVLGGILSVAACTVAAEEPSASSEQALPGDGFDPDPVEHEDDHVGNRCPANYATCTVGAKAWTTAPFEVALKKLGCTAPKQYKHRSNSVRITYLSVCPAGGALNNLIATQGKDLSARAVANVCDACLPACDPGWTYVFYGGGIFSPLCGGGCTMEPPPY
jgi:hypothetical protein